MGDLDQAPRNAHAMSSTGARGRLPGDPIHNDPRDDRAPESGASSRTGSAMEVIRPEGFI
jgi:hypothetical protein